MAAEPVVELTRDEILEYIDREARRRLKISGQKLLSGYAAGTLDHPGVVADLLSLADLLSDDDPVFG